MKRIVISALLALGLSAGAVSPAAAQWPGAVPYGAPPQLNLAHPSGYAAFMNPAMYPQFMNPATYAQFMNPGFYMQFANPENMMAWMNPAAYAPYMNPATYMQMMNPAAYMQFMNPATYMQWMNPAAYGAFMNPGTYMQWMNPAAYGMGQPGHAMNAPAYGQAPQAGAMPFNPFDPKTWAGFVAPGAKPTPPAAAPSTGNTQ